MEPVHQSEAQNAGPNGKAEKLPIGKLHSVQYLIALILAVLLVGLWRLQVVNSDGYRVARRGQPHPQDAPPSRRAAGSSTARAASSSTTIPPSPAICSASRSRTSKLHRPDLSGPHLPVEQMKQPSRRFRYRRISPIPLKQDITPDEQAFIAAHRNELPEPETVDEQRRLYPRNGFAAHLIGYVGEISEQISTPTRVSFYEPGDVVGTSGVEETYDSILRGKDGSRDVIVNSHGKEIGPPSARTLAVPGTDLAHHRPRPSEGRGEGHRGQDWSHRRHGPHTGEILAMVSRPTFDPNQFAIRVTRSYWNADHQRPRPSVDEQGDSGPVAPGSTFKIIMSLAGLGKAWPRSCMACNGGGTFYGQFHACDQHHGMVASTMRFPGPVTPSTTRSRTGSA